MQNCIRDITDALIAMCEDRDEHEATLSNSQIVRSVIEIFGAGKKPQIKRVKKRVQTLRKQYSECSGCRTDTFSFV